MTALGVVRVIGRLNVGGPAIQAITLTKRLEERGYRTVLVRGVEGEREGSMNELARELGVRPVLVSSLQRELGPHDAHAILRLVRIMRAERPAIVHTHAAKAGAVGRVAATLAGPGRPQAIVHTFHGHVLSGYFGPRQTAIFSGIERALARRTSRLVAVSDEVRDDLIRLRIAPAEQIETLPLGFDLSPFHPLVGDNRGHRLRETLGISRREILVTLVARLVPIKRIDRFLDIATRVAATTDAHFLIVGDGELAAELHAHPDAWGLGPRLTWAGMRSDMPAVMAASDLVCLTSDNEGTPVSLIEAQAAERVVVTTDVGGAATVVHDGVTGFVVPVDAPDRFAARVEQLVASASERKAMGRRGRAHVVARFALDRLVDDVDDLYRRLLGR